METKHIKTWNDFLVYIEDLKKKREDNVRNANHRLISELLYRGQPNEKMRLLTTLERAIKSEISVKKYYQFISSIKARIESVTAKSWEISTNNEFDEWIIKEYPPLMDVPGLSYMIYLRHHGLPSPLLDWTRSPYVAAYFAFSQINDKSANEVAIYVYHDMPEGVKTGDINKAAIQRLMPNIRTHSRHYLQQSEYTICTRGRGDQIMFASHEDVVTRSEERQDLLWKIVIPVSERKTFIEHLQLMNITPYSLFGTEDKLMEDIYLSEIFLRNQLS